MPLPVSIASQPLRLVCTRLHVHQRSIKHLTPTLQLSEHSHSHSHPHITTVIIPFANTVHCPPHCPTLSLTHSLTYAHVHTRKHTTSWSKQKKGKQENHAPGTKDPVFISRRDSTQAPRSSQRRLILQAHGQWGQWQCCPISHC